MPTVRVERGESLDKALRKFKRKMEREGLMKDIRKSEFYEKPSMKRRKKMQKARKKIAQISRFQKNY